MTAAPGADERRARLNLIRALNGGPAVSPRPRDWLDDILDDRPTPAGPPPVAPRLPDWRKGETADLSGPAVERPEQPAPEPAQGPQEPPAGGWADEDPDPARARPQAPAGRALEPAVKQARHAYEQLPRRVRTLLYTGGAAAAGWAFHLPQTFKSWITACGHDTTTSGALILGAGIVLACGVLVDRRTRNWWGPLPWLCRIPLASALLALALYAPGVTQ
jgi:hypothetical protein